MIAACLMIAAMSEPRSYICHRMPESPSASGRLDEAAWQSLPWTEEFVDIEGDAKPRPRHKTRVKMGWTSEGLWIGADLEEPHLWATLTEHDSVIFHDNDFEVFIDPDGDRMLYGELELNALNTTWDLLLPKPYSEGGRAVDGWEIQGLRTHVHLRGTLNDPSDVDEGWSVTILLPWHALEEICYVDSPPKVGDTWRINFSRVQWDLEIVDGTYRKVPGRPEHNWVWSPQGVINMHVPEKWGYLTFAE